MMGGSIVQGLPDRKEYLWRWADLLKQSLAANRESVLKLVPVGCGIPQPLHMLDPGHAHGKMTDSFTYQLASSDERSTINVMHHVYKQNDCLSKAKQNGTKCQILDMGANDGYYALLAGAYGCSVRSVEPQSLCYEHLSLALGFNTIPGEVNLIRGAVGTTGTSLKIPRMDQCNGEFQATHKHAGPLLTAKKQATAKKFTGKYDVVKMVKAESLAEPGTQVTLWHIDVEGAEVDVLNSGRELLLAGKVDHLILELVGPRWAGVGMSMKDGHRILKELLAEYHCRELSTYKYMGYGAGFVDEFARGGSNGEYWCFRDESFRTAQVEPIFPCLPHGSQSAMKQRLVNGGAAPLAPGKIGKKKKPGKQ